MAGTLRAPIAVGIVMPLADQRGGAEIMLMRLLRYSVSRRALYHVAFLQDGPMVAQVRDLGHQATVYPAGHLRHPVSVAQTVFQLAGWMRRERLDVVVSWMLKAHLYAGPAALLTGRSGRSAWFQHGVVGEQPGPADRAATILPCAEIWCCAQHAGRAQMRLWPHRRQRLIYPVVDLAEFNRDALPAPGAARLALGLPEAGPVVGMVARLERWKGCHIFVRACGLVAARFPEARFVVVGGDQFSSPGYRQELVDLAHACGVGERLVLPGHRTDVHMWMQAMDVLVNASDREPFGMTTVEAMALGKPVVASAAGGSLEIIRDGRTGRLYPPGDAAALAAGILGLLEDPDSARQLGRQGQADVRERFDARGLAAHVEAAVEELAPARGASIMQGA